MPKIDGKELDASEFPGIYHEIEIGAAAMWPEDANGELLEKQ